LNADFDMSPINKYKVSIFISLEVINIDLYFGPVTLNDDLDMSPPIERGSVRYTFMIYMKSPSLLVQNLYEQC